MLTFKVTGVVIEIGISAFAAPHAVDETTNPTINAVSFRVLLITSLPVHREIELIIHHTLRPEVPCGQQRSLLSAGQVPKD
jgi:hypothetical protein